MGTVYLARDDKLDRNVAIKMLHPHLAGEPQIIARFNDEARIQAALRHPNIVSVYDFINRNDQLGIVMEYIEGLPFDELMKKRNGPMPWQQVIDLVRPILFALEFAHSKGVIHRDVKPGNLILENLGGTQIPKIMDFGIARALGAADRRTSTGTKMGTIWYMSPEQCRGRMDLNFSSDIYSMAVSIFEMLTGRVPFQYDSDYDLITAVVNQPPPPARSINPDIPMHVERALLQAMAKNPADRFPSAGAFAQALSGQSPNSQQVRNQQPTPMPQPGTATFQTPPQAPLPSPSNQNRNTVFIAIGILGVALITSLVLFLMGGKNIAPAPAPQVLSTQTATAPVEPDNVRYAEQGKGRWPFTSTRQVTTGDLTGLSSAERRVMRNEIYARHGRAFVSPDLQNHFSAQSWYRYDPNFQDRDLTSLEARNVEFIKARE